MNPNYATFLFYFNQLFRLVTLSPERYRDGYTTACLFLEFSISLFMSITVLFAVLPQNITPKNAAWRGVSGFHTQKPRERESFGVTVKIVMLHYFSRHYSILSCDTVDLSSIYLESAWFRNQDLVRVLIQCSVLFYVSTDRPRSWAGLCGIEACCVGDVNCYPTELVTMIIFSQNENLIR